MTPAPTIDAEVTFLSKEEGDRTHLPVSSGFRSGYRPHLVVQSLDVREAVIVDGYCVEDYLGVIFLSGPTEYKAGQPTHWTLMLGYHPDVDYSALKEGATFTVREGGKVVGYGKVVRGV